MATQGSQANAKDDTLYYAERAGGAFSVLGTDLSQHADNQTVAATWTYEAAPATRFDVTGHWCAEVEFDADNTDTGRFFGYAQGGGNGRTITLRISAGGVIDAIMNPGGVGTVVATLTLPSVSGSDQRFIVAWATEPNPHSGSAIRSELRAWNISAGTYAQAVATHADRTAGTGVFAWWALEDTGSNPFTGTPHMCRFSAGRFKTATETAEDFVATTSAPTITGQTRLEFPVVEPGHALADPGQFVGPVVAQIAASAAQNDLRTLSPIVDESFLERTTYSGSSFTGAPTQWQRTTAPLANYILFGAYVYDRPVPAFVDRLKVRINVQQWRTAGATADRLHFRVWSLNRPPQPIGDDVTDHDHAQVIHGTADTTVATSHGSGASAGGWLDLGLVRVARNSAGRTWLVLGCYLEDLSGTPANNRLRINAITIDPVVAE